MTKTTKDKPSIHEMAIRLLEGGIVEIDNLCFSMTESEEAYMPCLHCELDSICSRNIKDVCVEADLITGTEHIMILH